MNYGRYQVVTEIGRGSMGVVYQAHDPQIDRLVALKVLREDRVSSEDYVKRFLKEATAVGRLSHRSIVTVFDIGQDHGTIYIAMELLEGAPLDDLLKEGRLDIEKTLHIAQEVAEALHYAHQKGIVHRDIKPANIICMETGEVKVTDFGIAHIEDPDGQQMTQAGEILGTPIYMSPEQVMGQPVDGRSDIYSLGVILYELTTGARPFKADNLGALFKAITGDEITPPCRLNPDIPVWFSGLIEKAMAKEPESRYSSGAELSRDLQRRSENRTPVEKPKAKTSVPLIALVIMVFTGIGVGSYYYQDRIALLTDYLEKRSGSGSGPAPESAGENGQATLPELTPEQKEAVKPEPASESELHPEERKIEPVSVHESAGVGAEEQEPELEPSKEPSPVLFAEPTTRKPEREVVPVEMVAPVPEFQPEPDPEPEPEPAPPSLPSAPRVPVVDDEEFLKSIFERQLEPVPAVVPEPALQPEPTKKPEIPQGPTGITDSVREPEPVENAKPEPVRLKPAPENVPVAEPVSGPGLKPEPAVLPETLIESGQDPPQEPKTETVAKLEPVTATALLKMRSRPKGASVYIGGELVGKTPLEKEFSAELHEVELKMEGFGNWTGQIDMSSGGEIPVSIRLLPK